MTALSDAEIMRQVQSGEVALFDLLVDRYRPALLRVAESKLGSHTWAEDVVQETFLAAFVSRHTYRPQFAFRTWLWTILLNLCRKQWKRSASRPQSESLDHLEESTESAWPTSNEVDGLARLLALERRTEVETLLQKLSEPQADALRLRFFGELPYEEIAATMGSSLSAAKQRVRFGLEKLAAMLHEQSGGST
ncbi:MAG: RNA polymerase sigma factor [Planctomycetota bacterium]|nr:RNA polymerase sigma factor [Planctomycetota bacterium]